MVTEYWLFCPCGRKIIAHPPEPCKCECGRKYIWKAPKGRRPHYIYAGRYVDSSEEITENWR